MRQNNFRAIAPSKTVGNNAMTLTRLIDCSGGHLLRADEASRASLEYSPKYPIRH